MTEQNKGRPLAVGDMVVCHLKEGSRVGVIKTINPYFSTAPCFVDFGSLSLWILSDHIITIRKPRKGGKEARDIVAMLAHKYWMSRKREWRIDKRGNKKNYRLKHWSENTMTCLEIFVDAKSML